MNLVQWQHPGLTKKFTKRFEFIIILVSTPEIIHATLCAIWYYLYNLKNVKNTHEGVLLLVKLQTFGCFSDFLNCTNGTKSRNVSRINVLNR